MVIVGDNLKGLIQTKNICSVDLFDEYSIRVRLERIVFCLNPDDKKIIRYGVHTVDDSYEKKELDNGDLLLEPGECVLACSVDKIQMPLGYMGFVQTKGTLARLFVAAHCADAQIEPGFSGKVTLELINQSPFKVAIPVGSDVAQIYVMRCSTDNSKAYDGRYKNKDIPTLPLPFL